MSADKPCERCAFVPTPDGACICREMAPALDEATRQRLLNTQPTATYVPRSEQGVKL